MTKLISILILEQIFLTKIFWKKIDWYSINNLRFLNYSWFLPGQNSPLFECHLEAFFYKTGCQIDINFHLQTSLQIFDKDSADKIWSLKDMKIITSTLMPITVKW